jgi:hypothetical protein
MSNYYAMVSALIFAVVAVGHLIRLLNLSAWPVTLARWPVVLAGSPGTLIDTGSRASGCSTTVQGGGKRRGVVCHRCTSFPE